MADTNCSLLYLYHEQPWQQQLPVIKNAGTLRGAGPQEARNVARRGRHKARMRQERGKNEARLAAAKEAALEVNFLGDKVTKNTNLSREGAITCCHSRGRGVAGGKYKGGGNI